jgi:hypothetical protein
MRFLHQIAVTTHNAVFRSLCCQISQMLIAPLLITIACRLALNTPRHCKEIKGSKADFSDMTFAKHPIDMFNDPKQTLLYTTFFISVYNYCNF